MSTLSSVWDEELSPSDSLSVIDRIAAVHASNGGSVGALILKLIEQKDYASLVLYDLDCNSSHWSDNIGHLIDCRQALAFYQKSEWLDIGLNREDEALFKFWHAEQECNDFNSLLRKTLLGDSKQVCLVPSVVKLLVATQRKVRRIMGRCPNLSELSLKFGPGATTAIRKKNACPMNKLAAGFQCSSGLLSKGLLTPILAEFPHWTQAIADVEGTSEVNIFYNVPVEDLDKDLLLQWDEICETQGTRFTHGHIIERQDEVPVSVVPGNIGFVPKNAKTHRITLTEPTLNMLIQKGIGSWLERRLRKAGLNIRDQSKNARLARVGSFTGLYATLDLSSASDLISYELVHWLVSEEWWELLTAARTGAATLRGHGTFSLQKFSSMGNGFTFPLETLIFWAISVSALSCSDGDRTVSVYGDDIIVPSQEVRNVVWALEACGFSVNADKSYVSGPFRESCGHDYYNGISTRPYYQKHLVSGVTLFNLHNFYYRLGNKEMAEYVLAFIPTDMRLYGPDGYGDGHLLSEQWPKHHKESWRKKGYGGSAFETYTRVSLKAISRYPGDYVSPLYSVYAKDREELCFMENCVVSSPVEQTKSGRPLWGIPGYNGYKRVLIYTLAP